MATYPRLPSSRYRKAPEQQIVARPPQYSMLTLTFAVTLMAICFGASTWGGLPRFMAGFVGSVTFFAAACWSVSQLSPTKALIATALGTSCAVVGVFSRFGELPTVHESLQKSFRGIEELEHVVVLLAGCLVMSIVFGMFCGTLAASIRSRAE